MPYVSVVLVIISRLPVRCQNHLFFWILDACVSRAAARGPPRTAHNNTDHACAHWDAAIIGYQFVHLYSARLAVDLEVVQELGLQGVYLCAAGGLAKLYAARRRITWLYLPD